LSALWTQVPRKGIARGLYNLALRAAVVAIPSADDLTHSVALRLIVARLSGQAGFGISSSDALVVDFGFAAMVQRQTSNGNTRALASCGHDSSCTELDQRTFANLDWWTSPKLNQRVIANFERWTSNASQE
jgi:hypothetical protein